MTTSGTSLALNLGCGKDLYPAGPSLHWINLDRAPAPATECSYYQFDLEDIAKGARLSFADSAFRFIYASHVLEHIHGLLPLVEELWRVLSPDGILVARVPYALHSSAFGDPTHCRFFVPETFMAFSQEYYWNADYGYRGDLEAEKIYAVIPDEYHHLPHTKLLEMWHRVPDFTVELAAVLRPHKPARTPSGVAPVASVSLTFVSDLPKVLSSYGI